MAISAQPTPVRIHHDAASAGDEADGPAAHRATGLVAILTALVGFAGFAVLAVVFEFPDVLNRPAAEVLPLFAAEEGAVVGSYLALAMTGIGFAVLAVGVGRIAGGPRTAFLPAITAVGVLGGLAQTIGFIRWPFLVPVLSDAWGDPASSEATRASVATTYDALNAYAGGALGEHLGWVLQAAWGIGAAVALERSGLVGRALARMGLVLAAGFGTLTYLAFLSSSWEAVQGPVYTAWVLWVAVAGVVLVRRGRGRA